MRWCAAAIGLAAGCGPTVEIGINELGLDAGARGGAPWVELVNTTAEARDLGGWSLTLEASGGEDRWVLGDLTVPAEGFTVLWLDGRVDDGAAHAPFSLDAAGGVLTLADPDVVIESVQYPALDPVDSFGRVPDGQRNWQLLDPSPGETNGTAPARAAD